MRNHRHLGRSLLLLMLAVGLNTLAYVGYTHGRHAARSSRINYSHIPPHGSHRPTSRSSRGSSSRSQGALDTAHHDNFDGHVAPRSKSIGSTVVANPVFASLPEPEQIASPLASVNLLALGTAPRAPSPGRAPPTV